MDIDSFPVWGMFFSTLFAVSLALTPYAPSVPPNNLEECFEPVLSKTQTLLTILVGTGIVGFVISAIYFCPNGN